MLGSTGPMSQERFARFMVKAAKTTSYKDGFGVTGCDLKPNIRWVAYSRQSTREQAESSATRSPLQTP